MSYCKRTHQWLPASVMVRVINEDGEEELMAPSVPYFTCEECGKNYLSPYHSIRLAKEPDGRRIEICTECASEEFVHCYECGFYVRPDDGTYIESVDGHVCEHCLGSFVRCEDCNGLFHENEVRWDESDTYAYCESCMNEYHHVCYSCGCVISNEDEMYEEDGYFYCENCSASKKCIHNYSYKPLPIFNRICNEKKTEEYFGFEIEVDGRQSYAKDFLEEFGDTEEQELYLKYDGSVDGFEIVTHPMTRRFFYSKFVPKLRNGFKFLKENGFRGHNRAGIHIHVSSNAIDYDQLKKLMCLLYPEQQSVYKKWLAITQRHDGPMYRWSAMAMKEDSEDEYDTEYTKECKKNVAKDIDRYKKNNYSHKPAMSATRYTAINTENANTVEFRIFNSNIRPERVIKNAQVIFALLDFTKTNQLPTYHNYIRFVEENKKEYKELWDFLIEKKIVQPKEDKDKYKKLIKTIRTIDENVITYNDAIEAIRSCSPNQLQGIDDNDENERSNQCVSQF